MIHSLLLVSIVLLPPSHGLAQTLRTILSYFYLELLVFGHTVPIVDGSVVLIHLGHPFEKHVVLECPHSDVWTRAIVC